MIIGQRLIALVLISIACLSGCASYQIQTNKEEGYSRTLDRLAIWSAVGQTPNLGKKHWTQSDSFDNVFHATLKHEFTAIGVVSDVRPFTPSTDTAEVLARFETELAPSMRMLITPAKYQTMTSTYYGSTALTQVVFDLSLYETSSGRRVWRAQLLVDIPLGERMAWGEDGAKKLTQQIVDALRKDHLLGTAIPLPNR